MEQAFSRLELLYGKKALETLKRKRVAVFGVGGVGGYALEALARSAVGEIDVIDNDVFAPSNLNRQILATISSLGRNKVDVAEERIHSINPECIVRKHPHFYLPSDPGDIDLSEFDYVIDAIDTVSAKLDIITKAKELGVPIVSCMGCGNRLDPTKLRIADIYETSMDPLSKLIRRECRKRGIKSLYVVYSEEEVVRPIRDPQVFLGQEKKARRKDTPGSISFVPSVAGLLIASVVINELSCYEESRDEALHEFIKEEKERTRK